MLPAASKWQRAGAKFIANHIIEVTDRVFDDFAKTGADRATNLQLSASRAGGSRDRRRRIEGGRLRVGMVGGGR
jgi:hypothetical protein